MTVNELAAILQEAIDDGRGDCQVECCNPPGDMYPISEWNWVNISYGPNKGTTVLELES